MEKQDICRLLWEQRKIIKVVIAALKDNCHENLASELAMVENNIAVIAKEISDKTFYKVKDTED